MNSYSTRGGGGGGGGLGRRGSGYSYIHSDYEKLKSIVLTTSRWEFKKLQVYSRGAREYC